MSASNSGQPSREQPRWWPAFVFLGLVIGAIVWVRFFWDVHQQDKNVWTFLLCGVGFLCLLLWLMVLSQLAWRTRWIALGVIGLLHGVVIGLFRIEGVDGDLVPIVKWRWERRSPASHRSEAPATALSVGDRHGPGGWPQFLGPNRNGVVALSDLETDWEAHPPRELWRVPIGPGWSGFAVVEGLALTQEQAGDDEVVLCLDAQTGNRRWSHRYPARYSTTIAGEGPRATPTVNSGRVYAAGATGWLTCLRLLTGEVLWARNIVTDHGGTVPEWGYSVSPLLDDGKVIMSVGGTNHQSLVALDAATGETLWAGGEDRASYSSPILCEWGGSVQVAVFNMGSVAGHDAATGQLLWEAPYSRAQVHVAAPLVIGTRRILFSSGYGHGSVLYAIRDEGEDWHAEEIWRSRRMKAKFTNLIEHEGHIYGLDDGILACISSESGELRWKDGRYGHGQILLAGDWLVVLSETGELVLVNPNPEGLEERASLKVFPGKTWNPPALAGRHLYLRTDREAVCLELPVRAMETK